MIKVLFICLGNICRSPLARFYFKDLVAKHNLSAEFYIESRRPPMRETGNPYIPERERSWQRQASPARGRLRDVWRGGLREIRLSIGMDQANIRNITQIAGGDPEKKIYKMLEFAGDGWKELKAGKRNLDKGAGCGGSVVYGNFDDTWRDVAAGCEGLLKFWISY